MSCDVVEQRTGQRPAIKALHPREYSEDELAMMRQRRKNRALYQEQGAEIVRSHPDKHLLIVGTGTVHAFEKRSEMFQFMDELESLTRKTVFMVPRWQPARINTGYRRVIR